MGRVYEGIDGRLARWLVAQPVFFVASAPLDPEGSVNCSPKGNRDELRVLGPHRVAYVDQTGSGIETVGHLNENGRIVIMCCAFSGPPRIVRLHGSGRAVPAGDPEFEELAAGWPAASGVGVRAIIVIDVRRVADSCGYGVPRMAFEGHRTKLDEWSDRKGRKGVLDYQASTNATTIDGVTSGLAPPV